jgi:hypothetical protein
MLVALVPHATPQEVEAMATELQNHFMSQSAAVGDTNAAGGMSAGQQHQPGCVQKVTAGGHHICVETCKQVGLHW